MKKYNTIIYILLIAIVGLVAYLFFSNKKPSVSIEEIRLNPKTITIYTGNKNKLTTTIIPSEETDIEVIWKSNDESVVTVDQNGTITGISEGETDIVVSTVDGKISDSCRVTVKIPLDNISLDKNEVLLKVDDSQELKVLFIPETTTIKNVMWSSSNENIVVVDQNGIITGKSEGEAIITVTSIDTGKTATCKVKVEKNPIVVQSLTLNKTSVILDIGKYAELLVTVNPSDADNKEVSWTSSNFDIATVDQNGIVTAKNSGTAIITVTSKEGGKMATCEVTVNRKISSPIIPSNIYKQYESATLKWYIRKTTYYYLTYIWMEDPYNQIKKLEANTAAYGKIYTDDELEKAGLNPVRRDVGQMMNAYISNGMIDINKSAIGYNGSAFYVNGAWDPPIPFYHNRADSWIDLQDGILTRARFDDGVNTHAEILGIDKNGNLIDYGNSVTKAEREAFYKKITDDKTKNTWTSTPILIKNGTNISYESDAANRQAICQIDSNNYVMLTTIYGMGLHQVGKVFSDLGCINAYNLDGGGSTSFFYKMNGDRSARQIKCSDGKDKNVCRTIIEGIYFTEK